MNEASLLLPKGVRTRASMFLAFLGGEGNEEGSHISDFLIPAPAYSSCLPSQIQAEGGRPGAMEAALRSHALCSHPSRSTENKTRLSCQHCALLPWAKPKARRHPSQLAPSSPCPPLRNTPMDVTSSVLPPFNRCLTVGLVLVLPCLP